MDAGDRTDPTTLHVRRALDGGDESVAWIVHRFTPFLSAQARHRLGPVVARILDPDDIVADAWLIALERLPQFDPGDRRATPVLLTWLGQVVRNVANNALRAHLRGEDRKAPVPATDTHPLLRVPGDLGRLVEEAASAETSKALVEAIFALEEDTRELVILRGVEGLSNQEIGASLGLKPNTVSHRYARALDRLRSALPASLLAELQAD